MPNYEYEIGENCDAYLKEKMDSDSASCTDEYLMGADLIHLIRLQDPNTTIKELEDENVIIIKEELETLSIVEYTCGKTIKDVRIPSKIDEKTVTKIGVGAFLGLNIFSKENPLPVIQDKLINSVKIPDSILEIDTYSFAANELTNVEIGNSVQTIGMAAFYSNDLTYLEIPDSVKLISNMAFNDNEIGTVIIGDNVETISSSAFSGNSIKNITLGNKVKSIGDYAFKNNYLKEITIPDSVENIGVQAFYSTQIDVLNLGSGVTSIDKQAFRCNKLKDVTIPNNVLNIGEEAFYSNGLEEVVIVNGIQNIDIRAFGTELTTCTGYEANKITSVYIDINEPDDDGASIGINSTTFGWREGYNNSYIKWKDTLNTQ